MSEIEALCAVGGMTQVKNESWDDGNKDRTWYILSEGEVTVQKGVCVRPSSCPLRRLCTGKVRYANKEDVGYSSAVIREVIPTNFDKFEKEWANE